MTWRERARAIDEEFQDVDRRGLFEIPQGVTYLDGNSLGPLPTSARQALERVVREEWGQGLIRSWNTADWIHLPQRTGDRIARLIGAEPGTVIVGDSTSLNLYKALQAAVAMRPNRRVVVTDIDNFPTDLYIIDEVGSERGLEVRDLPRHRIPEVVDESVAVLTLTHVDYRTSDMADMKELTRAAHAVGALVVWDLAHSAGAVPVDLSGADVDFAVGCGYKFLNGGPGAPAFVYAAPRFVGAARQPLEGWMGHASPFAFDRGYEPATDMTQFLVGTPPVIAMSALHAALEVFDGISVQRLHDKSLAMAALFHDAAEEALVPRGFSLASQRDSRHRGSHVALAHPYGYAIVQALIGRGVIGDFRRPDIMRFGVAPLYNSASDIVLLVESLIEIVDTDDFDHDLGESAVV